MKNLKKKVNNKALRVILSILLIFIIYTLSEIINISNSIKITFSSFVDKVLSSEVKEVNIKGSTIQGTFLDGKSFITFAPKVYPQLIDDLRSSNIKINIIPVESTTNNFIGILISWLPMILLVLIWLYYLKNIQGSGNKAMNFGKSKAKLVNTKNKKITFNDIAGIEEAKNELQEIVNFLRNPRKFSRLGGKIPKGCLLVGPPGTGKTLLAKAMAGEASVPFFTISGSDFVEMFVGVGASRVRDMFYKAKLNAPCIVFIDEIDAVGRHRGSGYGGGNDEREQTLNQLLVEMDGFIENQGIIVVAATNRIDVIDSALLRAGRFDRQIEINMPDIQGRENILKIHIKKILLFPKTDIKLIARATTGFSGADLSNLVNEAALLASKDNKNYVTIKEFENAKDRILMGIKKSFISMSEEEKKITAYHESGHAISSFYLNKEPIHKVTIIPRGNSLGMMVQIPKIDKYYYTKEYFITKLIVIISGRVAEELFFGENKITTGASNDIKIATSIAENMVVKWGFNDSIGPLLFDINEKSYTRSTSEKTKQKIDMELYKLLTESYFASRKILSINTDKLRILASYLIKKETVTGYEIKELFD